MFAKRAQSESIPNGATSLSVNFSSALPNANYGVVVQMTNVLGTPIYQDYVIKTKTVNGFSVEWTAPTDSADYVLDYIAYVPDLGETSGDPDRKLGFNALSAGDNGKNVIFAVPYPDAQYAVVAMLSNEIDPGPQFQPVVITSKSMNGFVAEWPAPLDSSNYRLEFMATPWS